MSRAIATPDFYTYEWLPLSEVSLDGDGWVTCVWPDGTQSRCYALWLAENTAGMGLDPVTRESMIDPGDLPEPADLLTATRTDDGALELTWRSGQVTHAHPGWLRHIADGEASPAATLPDMQPWTAADFTEPPTVDGSNVLNDHGVLHEWLTLMRRFGLARLANTPSTEEALAQIMAHVGPIRGSNFGDVFVVKSIPNPRPEENSVANTGLNLGQHSDLPTREVPPGFQFLHCLQNDVAEGWSRMTDGLALTRHLEANHPAEYEALCTLRWTFVNRSSEADHRWTGPIIDHGAPGQPLTLRAFYPVRSLPDMDPADVPRAYAAMRIFSQAAHHPDLQMRYPFSAGDLVGFDNRRILHGRDAYDPASGGRYLRGCYLDQDDVWSRLRVLDRTRGPVQSLI